MFWIPIWFDFVVQNDWVISRVFQKSSGGKKIPISGLVASSMPPLIDATAEPGHVHCFSNSTVAFQNDFIACNPLDSFPWGQFVQPGLGSQSPFQDPAILRTILGSYPNQTASQETAAVSNDNSSARSNAEMGRGVYEGRLPEDPPAADCIWGY